jgi:protein-S-isoprenylcysteine O-methyltransferase Ste14
MLQQILTGQAKSFTLLACALALFVYFLPSVVAFHRGHRSFLPILLLNVLVSPIQAIAAHFLAPSLTVIDPHDMGNVARAVALITFGPGWVLLLLWALRPGEPDPRLLRAQDTKTYDVIVALPLVLWFTYGVLQLRAILAHDIGLIAEGDASLMTWAEFVSLSMSALFNLLLIYLLVVRDKPVAKSQGTLPRFFGFAGTFLGVSILQLPVAPLTLPLQLLATALIGLGSLASLLVLWRLGKSFSIMPEARRLVTGGPYAYARHPLYTVEMITITGTALRFAAPWSWLIGLAVIVFLWIRSYFEEQVLEKTYPEYAAYRLHTKRFIPGVF